MSAEQERLRYLLQKYTDRECTWEEQQELFRLIDLEENKNDLYRFMDEKFILSHQEKAKREVDWDTMFDAIKESSGKEKKKGRGFWISIAAAVLLFASFGAFFLINSSEVQEMAEVTEQKDIAPGGNKAELILADGSKITLDDAATGEIARQSGIAVTKTADGQIVYKVKDSGSDEIGSDKNLAYNSIRTPRGGKYQVALPDGSNIWLNSSSSLKFPTTFIGKERRVILTGEAYFEIAKNKQKPFIVQAGDAEIKVLGTHFNIMTYSDEKYAETTLIEGSVSFSRDGLNNILKPGQQARYSQQTKGFELVKADIEHVLSWHNGLFVFDNTSIEDIMRNVQRWYDVDVIYQGLKPSLSFTGVIPRDVSISKVLNVLESTGGVQFKIQGKSIICSGK